MSVSYRTLVTRPKSGRVWRFGDEQTTVLTDDGELRKRVAPWRSRNDTGHDLAYATLDWWQSQGWTGAPSSPAALWHRAAREIGVRRRKLWYPANVIFSGLLSGGWVEAIREGHIAEHSRYYDLRSAYRWAGCEPLPDPETYRPYRPGDERFVAVLEVSHRDRWTVPDTMDKWRLVVTHEDPPEYKLHGRLIYGVSWTKETRDVARVFDWLDASGAPAPAVKMAGRGYWGAWAQMEPIECEVWRDGACAKSWSMPPRFTDLVTATVIVHRVVRRLWRAAKDGGGILAQTDALLTTRELETGPNVGDWQLKEDCPGGVFVLGPGRWSAVPIGADLSRWLRHSGLVKNSGAWLDMDAINALRERRALAESELQRAMDRRRRGETVDRLAESERIREILRGPGNPWKQKATA